MPILGLVAAGAARLLTSREDRRFAAVLMGTAVLALLLAAGTSFPPTAGAFWWIFDHVPLFGVYREPQKFLALVVVAYSVFGSAGLHDVLTGRRLRFVHVSSGVAVATVLAYGAGMFWGFGGEARLSEYPDTWTEADRRMDEVGSGRLLVLPWHLYAVWTFSDGRIVANPAPSFFSREVLAGDETGFDIPAQSPDPSRGTCQRSSSEGMKSGLRSPGCTARRPIHRLAARRRLAEIQLPRGAVRPPSILQGPTGYHLRGPGVEGFRLRPISRRTVGLPGRPARLGK